MDYLNLATQTKTFRMKVLLYHISPFGEVNNENYLAEN